MNSLLFHFLCILTAGSQSSWGNVVEKFDFHQSSPLKREGDPSHPKCPLACHCLTPERVDCSAADLDVVPVNISHQVVYLVLSKNRLQSLPSKSFNDCPLVRTLDLQYNRLSDEGLPQRVFAPLTDLHHLYLTGNRLQKVPDDLPDTLITLHLSGNEITQIDPHALAFKKLMRHLYLHDNQLARPGLSPEVFKGMSSLRDVTLSNNELTEIPPLPASAERIYLQSNAIRAIPENVFRRAKKIRMLFMQKNHISDDGLAKKSFAGLRRIEYIDLSDNELTSIPMHLPTKLRRLHLEKNRISSVSKQALDRLRRLECLLLHQNQIKSSDLEPKVFSKMNHLHTLHIFRNELTIVPHHLPRNLHVLVLMNNKIKTITNEAFRKTRKLRDLDLRYNKLNNRGIARGALRKLGGLRRIDFSGNKLRAVPVLPRNLTMLILCENNVSRIPPYSLSRTPQLRHLTLRKNNLRSEGIPLQVFRNNANLQTLDLSENHLTKVPPLLPVNVEFLYLQNNAIARLSKEAFRLTPKLRVVNLQHNRLLPETTSRVAFSNLRQLRHVYVNWAKRKHSVRGSSAEEHS